MPARSSSTPARRCRDVRSRRQAEAFGLRMVQEMGIDSLRAEITLFEAARAYAGADGRPIATPDDVRVVAPMALRLRRSEFMDEYLRTQQVEERQLRPSPASRGGPPASRTARRPRRSTVRH